MFVQVATRRVFPAVSRFTLSILFFPVDKNLGEVDLHISMCCDTWRIRVAFGYIFPPTRGHRGIVLVCSFHYVLPRGVCTKMFLSDNRSEREEGRFLIHNDVHGSEGQRKSNAISHFAS